MDTFEITSRLVSVVPTIEPDDYEQGIAWYRAAHDLAVDMSETYRVPLAQVAGLISAFSINSQWSTNIEWVKSYLEGQPKGMKVHLDKADRIMQTTDESAIADILSGMKCRSFFHNILYVEESHEVTLDRWIARAVGCQQQDLKKKYGHQNTLYERVADVIRSIAALMGIKPLELQAAIWVAVRGSAD